MNEALAKVVDRNVRGREEVGSTARELEAPQKPEVQHEPA